MWGLFWLVIPEDTVSIMTGSPLNDPDNVANMKGKGITQTGDASREWSISWLLKSHSKVQTCASRAVRFEYAMKTRNKTSCNVKNTPSREYLYTYPSAAYHCVRKPSIVLTPPLATAMLPLSLKFKDKSISSSSISTTISSSVGCIGARGCIPLRWK